LGLAIRLVCKDFGSDVKNAFVPCVLAREKYLLIEVVNVVTVMPVQPVNLT